MAQSQVLSPAMNVQAQRALSYIQQLQLQVAAQVQTIATLTAQLSAAQAAALPSADAATFQAELDSANVP